MVDRLSNFKEVMASAIESGKAIKGNLETIVKSTALGRTWNTFANSSLSQRISNFVRNNQGLFNLSNYNTSVNNRITQVTETLQHGVEQVNQQAQSLKEHVSSAKKEISDQIKRETQSLEKLGADLKRDMKDLKTPKEDKSVEEDQSNFVSDGSDVKTVLEVESTSSNEVTSDSSSEVESEKTTSDEEEKVSSKTKPRSKTVSGASDIEAMEFKSYPNEYQGPRTHRF